MTTMPMDAVIPLKIVKQAQQEVAKRQALPDDWSTWFPHCVHMRLELRKPEVTIADLIGYALARLTDPDPGRYLEAAQCLALVHYLGGPSHKTIVAIVNDCRNSC